MPRFRETIPIDDYVLDVLMRDLIGHDQKPAAYLVYLHLYGHAVRHHWNPLQRVSAQSLMPLACRKAQSKLRSPTCAVDN